MTHRNQPHTPSPDDNFPAPSIPVETAWAEMKARLEKEIPGRTRVSPPKKYFYLFLGIAIVIPLCYLFTRGLLKTPPLPQSNLSRHEANAKHSFYLKQAPAPVTSSPVADSIHRSNSSDAPKKNTILKKTEATQKTTSRQLYRLSAKTDFIKNKSLSANAEQTEIYPSLAAASPSRQWLPLRPAALHWNLSSLRPVPAVKLSYEANKATSLPGNTETFHQKRRFKLIVGLQWKVNASTQPPINLLLKPNEIQAIGTHFIPEFWAGTRFGKRSELTILVSPFSLYRLPMKTQRTITPQMTGDSLTEHRTTAIVKTAAISSGLYYGYSLGKNWIVGAGAAINLPTKALAASRENPRSPMTTWRDSLFAIGKSSPEWSAISPAFLTGQLHLAYRTGPLNIGAALIAPGTSILAEKSVRPLHAQIFIKWNWFYKAANSHSK